MTSRLISRFVFPHRAVIALFALALLTRLPLLSVSLDEVDAANFVNALTEGYNVPWLRPHPPGYPVYIFMGWLLNQAFHDPLLSLTLLSALLGSLTVVPIYLLLREFVGPKLAVAGSLLFVVNPLAWSLSEAALSDAPSMFFGALLAWLCYRARHSDWSFIFAAIVASLAIGVRQPNVALMVLLAFPIVYRLLARKEDAWKLALVGAQIFLVATLAWLVPMIVLGSGGIHEYAEAIQKQWTTAVSVYDFTQVDQPWVLNVPYRIERFFVGYFFISPWAGIDAKTPATLALLFPWLFGFGLFVTGFNPTDPRKVFTGLWAVSIIYTIMAIHFLPRYALPQLPAFLIVGILGYQFLGSELLRHRRRFEILGVLGIGCILVLFAIKHQPPVDTFEFSPPPFDWYLAVFLTLGALSMVVAWTLYHWPLRRRADAAFGTGTESGPGVAVPVAHSGIVLAILLLLVIPYGYRGYATVSVAHQADSPTQQMVEFVKDNYELARITPCWDHQTHSFFDAVTPQAVPAGYWSMDELDLAHRSGRVLLVTEICPRFAEIEDAYGLIEVARFQGESILWAKTPRIRLFQTPDPSLSGRRGWNGNRRRRSPAGTRL